MDLEASPANGAKISKKRLLMNKPIIWQSFMTK